MADSHPTEPIKLRGIAVSPGIIIGKARLIDRSRVKILYQYLISSDRVAKEVERFKNAVQKTRDRLTNIKNRMPDHVKGHVFILDSHLMILEDSTLYDSTINRIRDEQINAEWALKKSFEEIRDVFQQIDDEYISNRIEDVQNVIERILRNLSGQETGILAEIDERVIIVAHNLSPGDTSELNINKVMGFITDAGGRTSHTAIMAQALDLPAVMGLGSVTEMVEEGQLLIVDGTTGEVIINPDDDAIIHYHEKQLQRERYKSSIISTSHLPAETLDGHRIAIMANTEFYDEVSVVKEYGGEGVGLYRTEFLYLKSKGLPDEEELFEDYRNVAETIMPEPVIIRTLDLGGDKFTSISANTKETNPALGLRAIRLCLKKPDIFKTQLSAILRASVYGNIKIMFPMISGVQEILDAKRILEQVKDELEQQGLEYNQGTEIGIMIEVPSAVAMAEALADQVDFFSIGTNDLIQYALAIDRINEDMAYMYEPFHPAVLKMIQQVITVAKKSNIGVSICGEMAGDPLCIPILLGLGLDTLSMNVRSIPLIKKVIRSMSIQDIKADFEEIMRLNTSREVRSRISDKMERLLPELYGRENS